MWGWRDRESPDSGRRKLFQMWLHIYMGNTWDLAYGCSNEEQEIYLKWCSWATCTLLKATGNSPIISEVNGHSSENCDSSKSLCSAERQQKGAAEKLAAISAGWVNSAAQDILQDVTCIFLVLSVCLVAFAKAEQAVQSFHRMGLCQHVTLK